MRAADRAGRGQRDLRRDRDPDPRAADQEAGSLVARQRAGVNRRTRRARRTTSGSGSACSAGSAGHLTRLTSVEREREELGAVAAALDAGPHAALNPVDTPAD